MLMGMVGWLRSRSSRSRNLWLLATRSKNEVSANRIPTIPLLTDGRGVVSGIVMIVAGVYLSAYAEVEVERRVAEAGTEQQSVLLASLIRSQGLEAALQQMAAEVPTPQQVENGGDKLVHGSGGISQPRAE